MGNLRLLLKPLAESCLTASGEEVLRPPGNCELVRAAALGYYRVVFHPICCYRLNVLFHLLQGLNKPHLKMVEIGVHEGAVAEYLLDRLPSLEWLGVDPYTAESGENSGDEMF